MGAFSVQAQQIRLPSVRLVLPLGLMAALGLLPLIVNPWGARHYDDVFLLPKLIWLYAIITPTALGTLWAYRSALRSNRLFWLLGAFATWLALSGLFSPLGWTRHVGGAFDRADGLLAHLCYLVVALALFAWGRSAFEQVRKTFTVSIAVSALACAAVVAAQALGWLGIVGGPDLGGVVATLGGGTLGNRGYMAGFLALALPLALQVMSKRTLYLAPTAMLFGFAIAGTWTRGGWLAAGVALALWAWRAPRLPAATAVGGVAVGALICVLFTQAVRPLNVSNAIDDSGRTVLYKTALSGIAQRPVFGWGSDGVLAAMHTRPPEAVLAEMRIELPRGSQIKVLSKQADDNYLMRVTPPGKPSVLVQQPINKVHNEYLDYAVSYGIPAALIVVCLMGMGCWRAWPTAFPLTASLAAYAVYLLTWPDVVRFAPVAWAVLGLALAARRPETRK